MALVPVPHPSSRARHGAITSSCRAFSNSFDVIPVSHGVSSCFLASFLFFSFSFFFFFFSFFFFFFSFFFFFFFSFSSSFSFSFSFSFSSSFYFYFFSS